MASAKEIVERMQLEAWARLGISTDQIEARQVDDTKKFLLSLSEVDPSIQYYDEPFLASYWAKVGLEKNKTTAFQNPYALTNFRLCWERLRSFEIAASEVEPLTAPLLASAPTGNLNAQAIRGDDGSKALLLEEDLQVWSLLFTHAVVALVANHCGDRIKIALSFDPKNKEVEIETFGRLLAFTAAYGRPGFVETEQGPAGTPRTMFIPEFAMLTNVARAGFITFVAGHEYAHLRLNHHSEIQNVQDEFKMRSDFDLKEIWEKYIERYRNRFPSLSLEVFLQKMRLQFFENEADHWGYTHAQATMLSLVKARNNPASEVRDGVDAIMLQSDMDPGVKLYFSIVGMLSFFLSSDYLERTIRTLASGNDGRDDPLLSVDIDVQDAVLRHLHPSPKSRLEFVCKMASKQGEITTISHELEKMLSRVWDEVYPLLQQLHASGVRPHRKWIDPSTEMSCTLV